MPPTIGGVTIDPQGQTLTVSITPSAKVYTDQAGTTLASFPATVADRTSYWMTAAQPYTVSVKSAQGNEIADATGNALVVDVQQGVMEGIAPVIDRPGPEDITQTEDAATAQQITDEAAARVAGDATAVKVTGGGVETIHNNAAATGAVSVDLALGNWHLMTLTGNTTLSFTGATASKACSFTLVVTQDGSGGHSLTLPVSVVWAGSVAPVFSTVAGAVTYLSFATVDGGATWVGFGSTLPTNVASGYLLLDGSALTPAAQLGTGTPDQTKFLRGDRTWQTIPADYFNWSMDGTVFTKVGAKRLYVEGTRTILGVRISCGTAPTGATVIVDVNKNGTTIFTTQGNRPTIAISANTSGAVTNMDVTSMAAGDYFTVDVDQVGSTVAGADLVMQVRLLGAQ